MRENRDESSSKERKNEIWGTRWNEARRTRNGNGELDVIIQRLGMQRRASGCVQGEGRMNEWAGNSVWKKG
jgi:hypothetical protein